jgi:hypothetical protein
MYADVCITKQHFAVSSLESKSTRSKFVELPYVHTYTYIHIHTHINTRGKFFVPHERENMNHTPHIHALKPAMRLNRKDGNATKKK